MKLKELFEDRLNVPQLIEWFSSAEGVLRFDLSDKDIQEELPIQVKSNVSCDFIFSDNKLSSFKNFPEAVGSLSINNNNFTSLKNIHKHIKEVTARGIGLQITGNPLQSHVLGLLKIKNLRDVILYDRGDFRNLQDVENIINKYLPEGDILECQQELIDAGLEEFAQL